MSDQHLRIISARLQNICILLLALLVLYWDNTYNTTIAGALIVLALIPSR